MGGQGALMLPSKLDKRFFDSTRGQIVTILRSNVSTVEELAHHLELTDNAVRAHLITLERDGLVQQSGVRRGLRKPHFTYRLTPEAERLFPKAYDALLNQLITALKDRFAPPVIEEILQEVGRSLAINQGLDVEADLETRVENALRVLAALGGAAEVVKQEDKYLIRSGGCPLAAAVAVHPEVCQLAETLIAEIVGVPVKEHCEREHAQRCRFEIPLTK